MSKLASARNGGGGGAEVQIKLRAEAKTAIYTPLSAY